MTILRALAVSAFPLVLLGGLAAVTTLTSEGCSSSSSPRSPADAATPPSDAGSFPDVPVIDASSTALQCGLPLNSTCPASAPCTFSGWMCAATACDGMFVITDGLWNYYYSSDGGELVGEVAVDDASLVSCPYGFQPPTGCTPVVSPDCSLEGGAVTADAGDASAGDATAPDDGSVVDGGSADANAGDASNASEAGPLDGSADAG